MEKKKIKRVFIYKGKELEDPNPTMTIKEVQRHYSAIYPEITNAEIEGPKNTGGRSEIKFKVSIGTHG